MSARQQRGGVGARHPNRKAVAGEGRHVGEAQQRAGDVVDAPTVVACMRQWGKKMSLCFLFFFGETVSY
jgi:hypothetical protein